MNKDKKECLDCFEWFETDDEEDELCDICYIRDNVQSMDWLEDAFERIIAERTALLARIAELEG